MSNEDPKGQLKGQLIPPLINPRKECVRCRARIWKDAKRCQFCAKWQAEKGK